MSKIWINGVVRDMTLEEEAAYLKEMENMPKPEPTPEDRIKALEEKNENLEAKNKHLEEALELLLSGVTADE